MGRGTFRLSTGRLSTGKKLKKRTPKFGGVFAIVTLVYRQDYGASRRCLRVTDPAVRTHHRIEDHIVAKTGVPAMRHDGFAASHPFSFDLGMCTPYGRHDQSPQVRHQPVRGRELAWFMSFDIHLMNAPILTLNVLSFGLESPFCIFHRVTSIGSNHAAMACN
ncbi:MAG: hypothetical protein O7A03_06145 [Alphaproteobacteria bacterium]|nr:hypothetical protein [Alphaproteobacteria bacterium]